MEEREWEILDTLRKLLTGWTGWLGITQRHPHMFYRAVHSAMAKVMDGDKQRYNDALIAA